MNKIREKRGKKRPATTNERGGYQDETAYDKLLKSIDLKKIAKVTLKQSQKVEEEIKENEGSATDAVEIDEDQFEEDDKDTDDGVHVGTEKEALSDNESDDDDDDDDDSEETPDPFKVHFENDLTEEAVIILKEGKLDKTLTIVPGFGVQELMKTTAVVPTCDISSEGAPSLSKAKVKDKIIDRWNKVNKCGKKKGPFTSEQNFLFNHINSYQDVLYSLRDFENCEDIRKLYCMHAVNHILKTRTRVLKNNAKIMQMQKEHQEPPECRDQGLTRPKVLILVPFRDSALRIINLLIQLALPIDEKAQVMKKKRFYEEFKGTGDDDQSQRFMPNDFKAMFHGNTDDCFRVGITVLRRALKLYADFYSSDIIVASPLGIRTIIGAEGEKKRDFDFLSSIEVLILDQTDVFLMQNWEHLLDIFDLLNLQPKQARDADFSRVRMWSLNSWSKFYRQSLIFSSFLTPEINSLFNKHCLNYAGKVRIRSQTVPGSVRQVVSQIPQVFHLIDCHSIENETDRRFEYFINKVLPEFKSSLHTNTAIFIPSYFDFVRIRNYFKKEELSFLQINEYSERSNISRARTKFFQNKPQFLLFTERFYFFYRYRIRGIRNIIFYQLPLYPVFYPEIINFMDTDSEASTNSLCTIIYSKFDRNRLENITGTQQCKQILTSGKNIHMIVAGN